MEADSSATASRASSASTERVLATSLWMSLADTLRARASDADLPPLARVRPIGADASVLRIGVPTADLALWRASGRLELAIRCLATPDDPSRARALAIAPLGDGSVDGTDGRDGLDGLDGLDDGAEAHHTLSRFVVGPANQLAAAAARAVAEQPGSRYSPLFLHGPPVSGRTHLLHAIAADVRRAVGSGEVICLGAEALSMELVQAIGDSQLSAFRGRYRGAAALLVDDIETVAGRDATQEELVHTFETLQKGRAQIVVTGAHAPNDLRGLCQPLVELLRSGLTLRLAPPEWETRVAILIDRARTWGLHMPGSTATHLAARITADLDGIDPLLTRVISRLDPDANTLELEPTQRALETPPPRASRVSPERLTSLVARHFGLRIRDLRSSSRSPRVTTPRQIAMYLCRQHAGLSYPEIGRQFGRHHTTALHSCRRIQRLLADDERLGDAVRALELRIVHDLGGGG